MILDRPTFRPLRSRNFRLIWCGALISNVGTWMETVALSSLIAGRTRSATQVAVAAMAAFLPTAFASPIGSALADRFDRRRFLIVSLGFETFFAGLLTVLVALGERRTGVLSAVLFAAATVSAGALPNRQSLMPSLVAPEDLPAAISLGSASWNGGRVFGPLLASVVAIVGPAWAFFANTVSFVVMLIAWQFVRLPPSERSRTGAGLGSLIGEGLRTVRSNVRLRFAVVLIGVLAGTAGPFIGLLAIMAKQVHNGGTGTTGLFVSAQGLGAVIGAMLTTRLASQLGRGRSMLLYLVLLVPAVGLYGLAPNPIVAAAMLVVMGGCYMGTFAGAQSILQMNSPPAVRARVLALFSVSLGLGYCLALAVNGPLGDRLGMRTITIMQAVATAIGIVFLGVRYPKWWDRMTAVPEVGGAATRVMT